MTSPALDDEIPTLCVAGLVYFEVFLPDLTDDIPLGREIFVDDIGVQLGGALNPASVAAALGVDTTLAHPQGRGPTDAAVAAELQKLQLGSLTWTTDDDPAISLVRSEAGDRGFASRADYDALARCPPLANYDWVHVPGLEEAHRLRARLREARNSGTTVSVAGSWAPRRLDELCDAAGYPWDLLILNADEARRAIGDDARSVGETIPALQSVADNVIVTDGARRVCAVIDGDRLQRAVPEVEGFVDATGAGDAFGAGYIAARLHGHPPGSALERAIDAAGAIVQTTGGVAHPPFPH